MASFVGILYSMIHLYPMVLLYIINCFYIVSVYFQEGHIDMLSSDHSPTVPELKLLDDGNFLRAWGGISSLQVGVFSFRINLLGF